MILPKMLAAAKGGLIYVCNPNNPTASITPKDELRDFITKDPARNNDSCRRSLLPLTRTALITRAVIPLVKDHPNLIVSRTFSKIYGMAGLRCGYCVAQKETIERMRRNQMWDSVNCMALAAATASLDDPDHVPNGQRLNKEAKQFTTSELEKMGYKINSLSSKLHHVRLQTPGRSAHQSNERAERPRRPFIPGAAKSHAPHDRKES